MSKWDDVYIGLCQTILSEGREVANRTGVNTIKIPTFHFTLDVGEEFPKIGRASCRERVWQLV